MVTHAPRAHRVPATTAVLAAPTLALALLTQPVTAQAAAGIAAAPGGSARAHILALARAEMKRNDLNSVILSVKEGRHSIVTTALGKSMTDVRATTAMHFRIGSVAFPYLSTLLLRLRAEGRISLSDRLSRWFPKLPHASQVTLAMLIETRSGYADYVAQPSFLRKLEANPFRQWTQQELISYGINPKLFGTPGKFRYAHTNFVLLGMALAKATGEPLARLMRRQVLGPLGLTGTDITSTPKIPSPVLHAFTSERGKYEESTFWSPSWSCGTGEIMTSDITDLARTAAAIGTGALLSRSAYRMQTAHISRLKPGVYYGMGLFLDHGWIIQNPSLNGFNAVFAYLPSRHITIAITTTLGPRSISGHNYSTDLTRQIARYLAPLHPIT
jgi:CubicO group peptidase (beta-lactamase class C family)